MARISPHSHEPFPAPVAPAISRCVPCPQPQRRARLALVLADAAALAGWQAIDMGRLPPAWAHFEMATAAAREAADDSLLAFAAGEQAYVLLDLGQPAQALEKVRAVRVEARTAIPRLLRGWLHAAEAEMAAASGQQVTCRSALDLAARQVTHPQADATLPYLALDATHLARWRGNCLVQFGDTATITELTGALLGPVGRPRASRRNERTPGAEDGVAGCAASGRGSYYAVRSGQAAATRMIL
jgi:hypothetical protein